MHLDFSNSHYRRVHEFLWEKISNFISDINVFPEIIIGIH